MSGKVEGWFRPLSDGRTEIFLKAGGLKVRCSGAGDEMNALADLFEELTGLLVNSPDSAVFTRKRSGPKPIRGQLDLLDMTDAPVAEDDEGVGLINGLQLGAS